VIANLAIATTFITGLVLWDLLGHLPLPLGVAGHEGSTVIVGLNGMRLLAQRAWTTTSDGRGTRPSAVPATAPTSNRPELECDVPLRRVYGGP
jgi:hypothetical protein